MKAAQNNERSFYYKKNPYLYKKYLGESPKMVAIIYDE